MKLNYRDRIVLTVVIVVLVWVAGIMLFIRPSIDNLKDSQAALDDAKAQRSDLQDRVDADADLPERIVAAYKEVTELTESFYEVQETQLASQLVDDLLDEDEIVNLNMSISDYAIYSLNPFAYVSDRSKSEMDMQVESYKNQVAPGAESDAETEEGEEPAEGTVAPAPQTIGSYAITFNFVGKLEDVEKFCEKMQTSNDQKTMVINSLNYSFAKSGGDEDAAAAEDGTVIQGSMELRMMVVEKLPDPNTGA